MYLLKKNVFHTAFQFTMTCPSISCVIAIALFTFVSLYKLPWINSMSSSNCKNAAIRNSFHSLYTIRNLVDDVSQFDLIGQYESLVDIVSLPDFRGEEGFLNIGRQKRQRGPYFLVKAFRHRRTFQHLGLDLLLLSVTLHERAAVPPGVPCQDQRARTSRA